jgi:hypothetical protein
MDCALFFDAMTTHTSLMSWTPDFFWFEAALCHLDLAEKAQFLVP